MIVWGGWKLGNHERSVTSCQARIPPTPPHKIPAFTFSRQQIPHPCRFPNEKADGLDGFHRFIVAEIGDQHFSAKEGRQAGTVCHRPRNRPSGSRAARHPSRRNVRSQTRIPLRPPQHQHPSPRRDARGGWRPGPGCWAHQHPSPRRDARGHGQRFCGDLVVPLIPEGCQIVAGGRARSAGDTPGNQDPSYRIPKGCQRASAVRETHTSINWKA